MRFAMEMPMEKPPLRQREGQLVIPTNGAADPTQHWPTDWQREPTP